MKRLLALTLALLMLCAPALAQGDPLPSWREGEIKAALIKFVTEAADETSANYIPPAFRVAVSDMDGTLVSENGGIARPAWAEIEALRYLIANVKSDDEDALRALDAYDAMLDSILQDGKTESSEADYWERYYALEAAALSGLTVEQTLDALSGAHALPYSDGRAIEDCFYQPMLELYQYLCDNGFAFYVVSGSNRAVVSALCADGLAYRGAPFPYTRCIGADLKLEYDGARVVQTSEFLTVNVHGDKCMNIARQLGQVPVIALGNSTGDAEMLSWTLASSPYPSLGLIVVHDDEARERAYDADKMRALCEQNGWLAASMAEEFLVVYGE